MRCVRQWRDALNVLCTRNPYTHTHARTRGHIASTQWAVTRWQYYFIDTLLQGALQYAFSGNALLREAAAFVCVSKANCFNWTTPVRTILDAFVHAPCMKRTNKSRLPTSPRSKRCKWPSAKYFRPKSEHLAENQCEQMSWVRARARVQHTFLGHFSGTLGSLSLARISASIIRRNLCRKNDHRRNLWRPRRRRWTNILCRGRKRRSHNIIIGLSRWASSNRNEKRKYALARERAMQRLYTFFSGYRHLHREIRRRWKLKCVCAVCTAAVNRGTHMAAARRARYLSIVFDFVLCLLHHAALSLLLSRIFFASTETMKTWNEKTKEENRLQFDCHIEIWFVYFFAFRSRCDSNWIDILYPKSRIVSFAGPLFRGVVNHFVSFAMSSFRCDETNRRRVKHEIFVTVRPRFVRLKMGKNAIMMLGGLSTSFHLIFETAPLSLNHFYLRVHWPQCSCAEIGPKVRSETEHFIVNRFPKHFIWIRPNKRQFIGHHRCGGGGKSQYNCYRQQRATAPSGHVQSIVRYTISTNLRIVGFSKKPQPHVCSRNTIHASEIIVRHFDYHVKRKRTHEKWESVNCLNLSSSSTLFVVCFPIQRDWMHSVCLRAEQCGSHNVTWMTNSHTHTRTQSVVSKHLQHGTRLCN